MLHVALAELTTALAEDRPAPGPVPPDQVRSHALGPLAHTHGLAGFLTDYARSALLADRARDLAAATAAVLAAEGIPVALLKGVSYAGTLYADPAERPMTDVDLLVAPADAHAATAALRRQGYWTVGPSTQFSRHHHAVTLKRHGECIDLHRSPIQPGRAAIPLAEVWARTTASPRIPGARQLDPVDELLFHLANLIRHELHVPLLSYVDAGRLWRRLDLAGRAEVRARARAWRLARPVEATLAQVEHVLGWRVAPARWWLPDREEVCRYQLPARPVQMARKFLLVQGPTELARFVAGLAEERWEVSRGRYRDPDRGPDGSA